MISTFTASLYLCAATLITIGLAVDLEEIPQYELPWLAALGYPISMDGDQEFRHACTGVLIPVSGSNRKRRSNLILTTIGCANSLADEDRYALFFDDQKAKFTLPKEYQGDYLAVGILNKTPRLEPIQVASTNDDLTIGTSVSVPHWREYTKDYTIHKDQNKVLNPSICERKNSNLFSFRPDIMSCLEGTSWASGTPFITEHGDIPLLRGLFVRNMVSGNRSANAYVKVDQTVIESLINSPPPPGLMIGEGSGKRQKNV